MFGKDSKIPIYIAIVIAVVLMSAAGHYLIGPKPAPAGKSEISVKEKVNNSSDDSRKYYFVDEGNGTIAIILKDNSLSSKAGKKILEKGYSALKEKCNVVSRKTRADDNKSVTAYSVVVTGVCDIK